VALVRSALGRAALSGAYPGRPGSSRRNRRSCRSKTASHQPGRDRAPGVGPGARCDVG